jgi:DNA polymerase I-like protein with 3'-5' exonuclease and polymerase domains
VPLSLLDLPDSPGVVALDTETSGLFVDPGPKGNARVSIVSLAWYEGDDIVSRVLPFDQGLLDKAIPGMTGDLFEANVNLGEAEWDELCDWLRGQRIVMHNLKFDCHIMRAGHRVWGKGIDLSNQIVWDTQVTNPLFFPGEPTGLKPTSERLWGETEGELARRLWKWLNANKVSGDVRFDLAPWELVGPYAADDAEKTIRLWRTHMEMLEAGMADARYALIEQEVDLAICLFRMEQRGVGFDVDACLDAAKKLRKAAADLKIEIRRAWRRDVTPAAASWYFYEHLGHKPIKETDGGKGSADMDSIAALVAKGVPTAAEYQRYAQLTSALSKWYEGWPALIGLDGRLRCSYHQTKIGGRQGTGPGTVSGRLSVERVQLQAIPHDYRLPGDVPSIRSFFRAKDGHELWEVDIAQAEVRVATHAAKCRPMWEVLAAGGDIHGDTAIKVFDVDPGHPEWSMYRTLAKRLTFATLYGAGAQTFRDTIRIQAGIDASLAQCKEWLDEYKGTFPEFQRLYYNAQSDVRARGFVTLVGGRRRWFDSYERQFKVQKAFNQIIQGSVAEAMKRIKVEVEVAYPGILLNEIHDSLMLEVPAGDEGRAQVTLVEGMMLTVLEDMFPGWDEFVIPWAVDAKPWGKG